MRARIANDHLSVQAVAGTHVVLLGMDVSEEARKGLLGFTIRRSGGGRSKVLGGGLVFEGVSAETTEVVHPALDSGPTPAPEAPRKRQDSEAAPIQAFLWSDYTAFPGVTYTYEVIPNYGTPDALEPGEGVSLLVKTERPEDGTHGVYFNRGVAGSQAYARRFGKYRRSYIADGKWNTFIKPEDVPDRQAFQWLSRGLEEAMIHFLRQAKDSSYSLHASVYEFTYLPVIREFVAAIERGVDVQVVHHSKNKTNYELKYDRDFQTVVQAKDGSPVENGTINNRKVVTSKGPDPVGSAAFHSFRLAGIGNPTGERDRDLEKRFDAMLTSRTKPAISHNKFCILLKDGKPIQVWTGSTNFTDGGIFGQSNVGHQIRDEEVAAAYHEYWTQLKKDPANRALKDWTVSNGPQLSGDEEAPEGITPIFSPRANEEVLQWYADQIGKATHSVHLTSAFTISDPFLERLSDDAAPDDDPDSPFLRYVLLEGNGGLLRDKIPVMESVPLNTLAWGDTLKQRGEKEELVESLTGLNDHVNYLHTKYMLIDPLTDDPLVISGSANFSSASTVSNDENMVVIRGNTRVADIFLGEFMRLFNHYRIRNELNKLDDVEYEADRFLKDDDSWTDPYFDHGSSHYQERLLFRADPESTPHVQDLPEPELDLRYYMLDWDDNILFMPTRIHLVKDGQEIQVSTKEFATLRNDPTYIKPEHAYDEFRDGTGDFVCDTRIAIATRRFAPSFYAFKTALREARLFCIVTARGHSPETIRKGVEVFIQEAMTPEERAEMLENIQRYNRMAGLTISDDECLSDYLDLNGYVGVMYKAPGSMDHDPTTAASPEHKKTVAVKEFVEKTLQLADNLPGDTRRISFGFSDDDHGNLTAMRGFLQDELEKEFDEVRFFVYDTSGAQAIEEEI